jgi:GNAT superfamily N-acetyltransferase
MQLSNDDHASPAPEAGTTDAADARSGRRGGTLCWIPIRSLAPRHRPRIVNHLLALPAPDRYLRFGQATNEARIGRYVDLIDFERDEVFGIFNRRLELVAMAHLACLPRSAALPAAAEFGVSVASPMRGRGFGARLFEHAVLHARNRGIDTMVIHALSENSAMLHIVRAAGATIERSGPESEARLKLPNEDLKSRVDAMVEHQAAEVDYGIKLHVRRVDGLFSALTGLAPRYGKA